MLRYLLIVVVIKYSLLKSKMAETGSGSGPKSAVYLYYYVIFHKPSDACKSL